MNCTKPETLQWTQDVRKDTNCVRVKMVTDDFEVAALNPKLESRNPEASNLLLSGTHPDAGVHSLRRQEGIPTLSLSLSLCPFLWQGKLGQGRAHPGCFGKVPARAGTEGSLCKAVPGRVHSVKIPCWAPPIHAGLHIGRRGGGTPCCQARCSAVLGFCTMKFALSACVDAEARDYLPSLKHVNRCMLHSAQRSLESACKSDSRIAKLLDTFVSGEQGFARKVHNSFKLQGRLREKMEKLQTSFAAQRFDSMKDALVKLILNLEPTIAVLIQIAAVITDSNAKWAQSLLRVPFLQSGQWSIIAGQLGLT